MLAGADQEVCKAEILDDQGMVPLHRAALHNHVTVVSYLLDQVNVHFDLISSLTPKTDQSYKFKKHSKLKTETVVCYSKKFPITVEVGIKSNVHQPKEKMTVPYQTVMTSNYYLAVFNIECRKLCPIVVVLHCFVL